MVAGQIEKYIATWEEREVVGLSTNEYELIGEFMGDLNTLLKYAQEKQAACCAKKESAL